jgi:hypothetical protein
MPNWCTNRLIVIEEGDGAELQKFVDAITTPEDHVDEYDLTLPYPTPEILLGTRSPRQTVEQIEDMRTRRDAGEMKAGDKYVGDIHKPTGSWVTDEYLQEQLDQIKRGEQAQKETGFDNWYDWNCAHWSTKWSPDVHEVLVDVNDDVSMATISYQTAWGPAEGLILRLSELNPALAFVESYIEEGMGFWGSNVYMKGTQRHHSYGGDDTVMDSLQEQYGEASADEDEEGRVMDAITGRWQELMERAEQDGLAIAAVLS